MKKLISYYNGFSIIEILISLTIGLILLTGVMQLFLNGKMTYLLNESLNDLQENGRFISSFLPQIIRQSGYRSTPQSSLYPNFDTVFSKANPFLDATNNSGVNGSDILVIRFQGSGNGLGMPDGKMKDCLDIAVDANEIVTNIFALNTNSQLECRSLHPSAFPPIDQTISLIDGVENFQVLFGEDLDNDLSPDRYVPASFPNLDMSNVVSVRVSLLLQTHDEVSNVNDTHTYNLLDTLYIPPLDKRVRKVFTTTVSLRNRASASAW
ncbi:MAG: PilW family protein [Gammaproteobacteria bacterium]